MGAIVIFILILAVGAIVVGGLQFFFSSKNDGYVVTTKPTCDTCNGEDSRCEQECMMEAATKPIEYYDDEELDRFALRPSDSYTDEEAEEFREVLYTMKPDDVKGWNRSLILRGINVPNQIKDELTLMVEG
ncbi:MAG: hypothetical protein PUD94_03460 [Prevotellaceae bacterium]|nr:hypothetical protein [Prevotellaceae bacterium]MDD5991591.1 hypothetical protein [Prevotellaceae bacterium]MDD6008164.1 hypothetical protein [Prevotellaceae bacterium]MDD6111629.1 hypothetical protein [Prevotellaceae bacterium]MDD6780059.1 hypothetical protein [Prevotellaceae bacterium]